MAMKRAWASGLTRSMSVTVAVAAERAAAPSGGATSVLMIVVDDANDWTRVLGHAARTPHRQRLAERSAVFIRACCAAPACGPSRTSLLTGGAPTNPGVSFNNQPFARERGVTWLAEQIIGPQ
jgi:arylsulfatase A-like enzyme